MADILPFRALCYNLDRISPGEVLTQPYDKITPAMQERYYQLSPFNLVRVILGKTEAGDNDEQNVYSRAAASLEQWQAEGVLVQDAEPSIYVYSQTFKVPGDPAGAEAARRGFIALGRVDDYENKVVFRHEQTLTGPKADRLNLTRATGAYCELLFMVYDDPKDEVGKLLSQERPKTNASKAPAPGTPERAADVELRDEYGVLHRMWKVSDAPTVAAVREKMADKKLIIADGHHRYETALNFRNEMRQKFGSGDSEAPYERVMIAFVNMDAPGLVILPTHRVVFGLDNFNIMEKAGEVMQYFEIQDLGPLCDAADGVRRLREAGCDRTALLAVTAHNTF